MSNKSQFLKNNVARVLTGGGGKIDAAPGRRSPSGTVNKPCATTLGHGNSATRKINNKGSRSKFAGTD